MSTRYKRTNWVRRLEDFSSGCSSGFGLGQCLIAGILAIFSGISRLLPVTRWLSVTLSPDVPVVSTVGASSLKSPASIWRGVVFVAFVTVLMVPRVFAQCDISITPSGPIEICPGESVTLYSSCESLMDNNFNDETLGNGWNEEQTGQAQFDNPCGNGPNGSIDPYLWFGNASEQERGVTTETFLLNGNQNIQVCFDMRYSVQGGDFIPFNNPSNINCEGPERDTTPQGFHEGVYLEFSTDNGGTWNTINDWTPNGGFDPNLTDVNWNNYCQNITVPLATNNIMFSWRQRVTHQTRNDHWGLDNIQIFISSTQVDWSTGNTNSESITVSPTGNTTYTATIKDSNPLAQDSVDVIVKPETLSLSPTQQTVPASGGTTDFSIENNSSDCSINWAATKNDSWLSIISGQTGFGNGTTTVAYQENPMCQERTGTITVEAPNASDSPKNAEIIQQAPINSPKCICDSECSDSYRIFPEVNFFGSRVELLSDYAIVGSFAHNIAHIYKKQENCWKEVAILDFSSFATNEFPRYSTEVAITDSYAVVRSYVFKYSISSPLPSYVHIFDKPKDGWNGTITPVKTLESSSLPPKPCIVDNRSFGVKLAAYNDYIAVTSETKGTIMNNNVCDSNQTYQDIYIFEKPTDGWGSHNNIPDMESNISYSQSDHYLFNSISIDNNYIIAGVSSAAYIFNVDTLSSSPKELIQGNSLGQSVAISGNYAIVSAIDGTGVNSSVAVYVFKNDGGVWVQTHKLIPNTHHKNDNQIGSFIRRHVSVSIDSDYIIVGTFLRPFNPTRRFLNPLTKNETGSAYIFKNVNEEWTQVQKLIACDTENGTRDGFGYAVSISGDNAIVGSPHNDAAYFYDDFSNLGVVSGKVFFDSDTPDCEFNGNDSGFENWIVKATTGSNNYYTATDIDGDYTLPLQSGTYTIDKVPSVPYWQHNSSCPSVPYTVNVTSGTNTSNQDFPNIIDVDVQDLRISVGATQARPGFDQKYTIVYENVGTKVMDGSISFKFDNNLTVIDAGGGSGINPLTWSFSNLAINEKRTITVIFNVPTTMNLGDLLNSCAEVEPLNNDKTPLDNKECIDAEVVGSYDPNSKEVTPDGDIKQDQKSFSYTVHFQNEGTAEAIFVTVRDSIDTERLDLTTLTLGAASHPYQFDIVEGNVLQWHFDNIMLPSKNVNELESQGFFKFKVQLKPNNPIGTVIQNKASIYFDYNVPIDTNTVTNRIIKTPVINATANTGGNISPSGKLVVDYDSEQTFTIEADEGYRIADVKVNGADPYDGFTPSGTTFSYTFKNIVSDYTIEVSFAETCQAGLSIVPTVKEVLSETGTVSFDVSTNGCPINWTAQTDANWLTINSASGTNDGTTTVNYTANFGNERTATITVTADGAENSPQTVTVTQEENLPTFDLTVSKTGNGTISANGINCGSDCTETYIENTQVVLTATPDSGYQFSNWTADCSGSTNPNTVIMDEVKSCIAHFDQKSTITTTFYPSQDALIWSPAPDNIRKDGTTINSGESTAFGSMAWTWYAPGYGPGAYRGFIQFDLSSIPKNAVISEAKLSLYKHTSNGMSTRSGSNNSILQKVTAQWDENQINWNNQPATTSDNQTTIAEIPNTNVSEYLRVDLPNLDVTALVKDMVSGSNYGFMMRLENEQHYRSMLFSSSNVTDPNSHPKLVVVYENTTLACSAEPTIKSVNSGFWDSPNTWSENRVPGINDVVAIQKDHFIRIKTSYNTTIVDGLCNHGILTNWYKYWFANGYIHGYANMFVYAKSFIDNYGKIQGIDGFPYFYEGGHGSNVFLRTNGNLNNYADAKILSGKGRSSSWRNGNGGYVATFAKNIVNNGVIGAGDSDKGIGGRTFVRAFDKLLHTGLIHNGKSGNGKYSYLYVKAYNKIIMGSIIGYGYVMIDPATISILGADAKIEGKEITIYGGEDTVIEMKDLAEGAISSTGDITLAVGSGGNIDLGGITGKVFNTTSEVKIHTDNLKLNENVDLTNLIEASNIETAPAKIIYDVMVLAPDQQAGQQGETISINVTVANNGPETDTYNIVVTDASGWNLGTLPATVTLNGAETQELDLQVTLPTSQADNVITLTVTSQADSTVSKTIAVQVSAVAEFAEETEIDEEEAKAIMGDHKASGQLLDKSGNSVSGAIVKVGDKTAVTDDDGNWEIVGLHKGEHTITVSKEEYTFAPTKLNLTDDDTSQQATVAVLTEPVGYKASGTILDKEGNPIAGVTVQIGDKTALTDAAGNWEITDLAESNYTVTASKDGYIFGSKDFAVGNDQNASVSFKAESVLDVKVKSDPGTAQQGENITYTITVTNNGSEIATGVVLTDILPTDSSLVSLEALDGGDCSAETVSCTLSDLTPGATATIKLVISNTKAAQLVNTAKVTANNYPADVQITRTTVTPYFSVSLSDTPDPVTMGGTLHYTVEVDLSQFAPKDATGVELVMQLPNGIELENATTDHGTCDTSKLPTVTCTIDDLSVASAEAISHITVNLNVTLIDMGLLLLTHDAKVTSTDYPAHSVKERTKIFIGDVKVDMVFVVDTTNSMAAEINGVIAALKKFIKEIDPSKAPLIVLVEFKDDVRFKAATRDLKVLLGAVKDLKAEGGGTCPEASAEALTLAVEHLKDGGVILFTTDASPYADADLEKLGKLISGKDMNLVTILTGDCSNQDDWNVLP